MIYSHIRRFATTLPVTVTIEEVQDSPVLYGPVMEIRVRALNADDAAFVLDRLGEELKRMAKLTRDAS